MSGHIHFSITKFVIMYVKKLTIGNCSPHMDLQVGFLSQQCIDNSSLSFDVLTNAYKDMTPSAASGKCSQYVTAAPCSTQRVTVVQINICT
jgi:hypothetical protein